MAPRHRWPLLALAFVTLALGCATSDYGRITTKMADYEAQAARDKGDLEATKDTAQKIGLLNTLIRNTELQLKIARRINPETNPQYRSGAMNLEAARAEKAERIKKLEDRRAEYVKRRDGLSKN
jgi:hypothetical protein